MAFIYRDSILPSRMKWNSMSSVYQRFTKAWDDNGTTYDEKLVFYQGDSYQESKPLKRLLNSLGIGWEEFISSPVEEEIESIWFYIDPTYKWDGSFAGDSRVKGLSTRSTTQLVIPTRKEIAQMFNDNLEVGKEIRVNVEYGGASKRYVDSHKLQWYINEAGVIESEALDTEAIRATIESDPWYYLANARLPGYTLDNPQFQRYDGGTIYKCNPDDKSDCWETTTPQFVNRPSNRLQGSCAVSTSYEGYMKQPGGPDAEYQLGIFAAMGSNSFERIDDSLDEEISNETDISTNLKTEDIERPIGEIENGDNNYAEVHHNLKTDGSALKYTYSYRYKFKGISEDDELIDQILEYYASQKPFKLNHRLALTPVGQYKEGLLGNTKDTIYKRVLKDMLVYLDPYTGVSTMGVSNSLFSNGRLRVYEASMMRRSDFVTMIATSLETDFEVEEAEWWEKVLAVIIVILAVVAFIYTLGASSAVTAMALSQAAGYSAMVLTIGGYALAMFGGLSAGGLVEIIGSIAQIVGIIAMVAGVFAAIEAAGKVAAEHALKAAGKEVTAEAVKQEMLTRSLMDNVGALLEQSIEAATSKVTEFMTMGMDNLVSTITDGLDFINKALSYYQDIENKELQADMEELKAEQKEYETEMFNNQLKSPAEVWELTEDRITSYDALTELNLKLETLARGDNPSYDSLQAHLNSV